MIGLVTHSPGHRTTVVFVFIYREQLNQSRVHNTLQKTKLSDIIYNISSFMKLIYVMRNENSFPYLPVFTLVSWVVRATAEQLLFWNFIVFVCFNMWWSFLWSSSFYPRSGKKRRRNGRSFTHYSEFASGNFGNSFQISKFCKRHC